MVAEAGLDGCLTGWVWVDRWLVPVCGARQNLHPTKWAQIYADRCTALGSLYLPPAALPSLTGRATLADLITRSTKNGWQSTPVPDAACHPWTLSRAKKVSPGHFFCLAFGKAALFESASITKEKPIRMDGFFFGTSGDNGFTKNKTMIYRHRTLIFNKTYEVPL